MTIVTRRCVTHRLVLDRLVIMEPAVGKLPELQVRKLTRKNQTHSALFIGCCEHFSAVRYVSRVQLKPGEYPPRFQGEVTEWTLQRKLGMATDKYVHGKVITASYLLEQISVTLFGAIAIFGDMLSDVYMAYSLYNDKQYEELSGTLCGWSYQSLYACITAIVFAVWFLCSFIYAAKILAMEPRRQHLSESRPRSLLHLLSTWFVLAFNVPLWMLDLANPQQIQKLFCVKDDRNISHYGLIFVGQKLTDWKFTAKLAKSIQWPNIILEDILLTFLSAYIYSESGITLPAAVSLGFSLFSLVYKLAVHAPFVNAFCCKRCVNADADKKYDITLDDYENQSSLPDSDHQTTQKPSIQPPTPQTCVEAHPQPSDDIERTASMDTHTPRTPWSQFVPATSSSSRSRNLRGSSRSKMSILERQCTGDGIPPGGVAPYSSSKPSSGGKGHSEEEEKGLLNGKDDDIQLQPPLIHDVDDTIASGVPEYEKSEQPLTELISNGSPRSERRKGKRRCKSTQGDYCRPTSFFGWNSSEKAKAQARSKSYEPRAWQQFGSHLTTQQNVDLEEEISKLQFWRSSAAAASVDSSAALAAASSATLSLPSPLRCLAAEDERFVLLPLPPPLLLLSLPDGRGDDDLPPSPLPRLVLAGEPARDVFGAMGASRSLGSTKLPLAASLLPAALSDSCSTWIERSGGLGEDDRAKMQGPLCSRFASAQTGCCSRRLSIRKPHPHPTVF